MWGMKQPRFLVWSAGLAIGLITGSALGQNLYIYPQRGQSPEQQDRDRYACHSWAVQQTGFDPTRAQTASAPPPSSYQTQPGAGALGGAARGAALGAVGGAIAGDAGKGAAISAATGALFGGMRRRQQYRQQQQAQERFYAQHLTVAAQEHNAYNRAMTACLSGRGYTVQ